MFEKLPFRVEVIQTDNGAEFQSAFHWHVLDRGVQHVYIKPATPRLNGKVERSHRIWDRLLNTLRPIRPTATVRWTRSFRALQIRPP